MHDVIKINIQWISYNGYKVRLNLTLDSYEWQVNPTITASVTMNDTQDTLDEIQRHAPIENML
jgi:hypothetical protein